MTPYYKLFLNSESDYDFPWSPVTNIYPHTSLELQTDGSESTSLNAYWKDPTGVLHPVAWIEVHYSGSGSQDFVMIGTAREGVRPEVDSLLVKSSFKSHCKWAINDNSITWTFVDPPNDLDYAIWEFNPSGSGPPVRVKVILKRQNVVVEIPSSRRQS